MITSDIHSKDSDIKGVIIARGAMLADYAVVWPANITEEQKATAINNLKNEGSLSAKGLKSPTSYLKTVLKRERCKIHLQIQHLV